MKQRRRRQKARWARTKARRLRRLRLVWVAMVHTESRIRICGGADGGVKTRKVKPRADYANSAWARTIGDEAIMDPLSDEGRLFRRRFRVPFPIFALVSSRVHSVRSRLADTG